jgi:hypothetical protein
VSGYHDIHPSQHGIQLKIIEVMQSVDRPSSDRDRLRIRIFFRPSATIDVSPYGGNRCDSLQTGHYFPPADISCMNDVGHAGQTRIDVGTQESVGI